MNNRRTLLIALAAVPSTPRPVFAQAKKLPVVIGWLSTYAPDPTMQDLPNFKEALAALGRRDGVDVVIETRWAGGGTPERLRPLAVELAALNPAVIVTYNSSATRAAASTVPGIPIVQASGGALVERGLAASYARPGGLVTGLTNLSTETSGKLIELLLDLMPKLKRVGYLVDVTLASTDAYESAKQAV